MNIQNHEIKRKKLRFYQSIQINVAPWSCDIWNLESLFQWVLYLIMVQIFYLHYLCSQKMKRIDFTYGVISLTIFLLSPLIFDVFGNLDSQTLVVAIGKDSFNEKPIKFVYPSVTYGLIVFIFCNSLLLLFVSCDISMGKMTRFQILSSVFLAPLSYVSGSMHSTVRKHDRKIIRWCYGSSELDTNFLSCVFSCEVYSIFSVVCDSKVQVFETTNVFAYNSDSFIYNNICHLYSM